MNDKLRKSLLIFLVSLLAGGYHAQSVTTKFFKDRSLRNEVTASKGKFAQTVTTEADGKVTTEVKDLKKNEVIMRETYKGEEPFGIWFYKGDDKDLFLDYEFDLVYSREKFEENDLSKKLDDFFTDNDSLGYKAPVIASGEKSVSRFVINNLFFPMRAREEGIQGKVFVGFKITGEAKVEDFVVYKGTNALLDKEAVRTIRMLRVSSPPMVRGEAKTFRLMLPISYKIQ